MRYIMCVCVSETIGGSHDINLQHQPNCIESDLRVSEIRI